MKGGFHPDSRSSQLVAELVADAAAYRHNDAAEDQVVEALVRNDRTFTEVVLRIATALNLTRLAEIALAHRALQDGLYAEWQRADGRADRGIAEMGRTAGHAAQLLERAGAEPILHPATAARLAESIPWMA